MAPGPDARATQAEELIPGRRACAAALLGFCAAAYVALQPSAGNAEGDALAAQLPVWERTLPLHGHSLALALALIHRWLRLPGRGRETGIVPPAKARRERETGIVVYITLVSTVSGALTATGWVPSRLDAFGALSRPLRITTWIFSTPAMLLLIGHLAGASRAGVGAVIAVDVGMLVCGLLATTTPAPWAYVFALAGLLLLLPLLAALHAMFSACLSRLPAGSLRARAVRTCAASSLALWSGFAAIFVLSSLGVLSHRTAAVLWAVTDVAAKASFALTLLQSSTLTVEESLDDAARASNEARSRQLAQLCHEIRNPLFGVIGNLQELDLDLTEASTPPNVAALVATTLACTAQLRRTLDDFLDLAKADATTLRVVRGPTRLRPLLVDVCRQVLRAACDKGLAIFVHVAPPLVDKVFLLDAGRLSQVLSNFAWNSVKFTSAGSVTLRVTVDGDADAAAGGDDDENCGELPLLFEVIDTGFGISTEAQARLFLPFQTVHTDPTNISQKWGGTGLGLSICKVIGELLGGSVGVVSAKDAGSTFWLRMRAEWWADASGAGSVELGTSIAPGSELEEVLALSTTGGLRRRRGLSPPQPGAAAASQDGLAVPLLPSNPPRRYSLDAWALQARRALGSAPPPRRGRLSADYGRGTESRSLAEQLAAVAAAHVAQSVDGSSPDGSQGGTAVVSSALLATLRTLRNAVGEAEVAVAHRLGDAACAAPERGPSADGGRRAASLDVPRSGSGDAGSPSRPAAPAAVAASSSSPPGGGGGGAPPAVTAWPGPLRAVLVVDDEPVNTRLVARRLERVAPEVTVTVADDGLGMVDLCVEQRRRYDIVLLDQHMRGMNGDAAVAALRAFEQAASLPRSLVLACTGNSSTQDVERFEHAGFDGVITKPLDLNALVPTLAALVADRGAPVEGVRMFAGSAPNNAPAA